jgi:hypothetical protein
MPMISRLSLASLLACACSVRDAQVGAMLPPDGSGGGLTAPTLSSNFASDDGLWESQIMVDGASITFGSPSRGADDGRVALLLLPGQRVSDASENSGPNLATEIASLQFLRFGTLRARLQFPTCAAGEEVAAAMFWYWSDGQDRNGNGLADNPELDFHVLCGTPSFVVLTAWTDYQKASDGSETFLRTSRAVDLSSGQVYDGISDHERAYVKSGQDPALAHPGFSPGAGFYEAGIEWQADQVRFFIVLDGAEVTLWTMSEARFVPQVPLQFRFNLWHPATHWPPPAAPALYPAADAILRVDWFRYWAR